MSKKYLQHCKTEQVLPLPIIHKISQGVLALEDYRLNSGICTALASVLEDLGSAIHKIVLKNNGITDSSYAEIIKGAIKNPNIKSLALLNNEFREASLTAILDYFQPKMQPILEELVISQCKTKLSHVNELLKTLSDYYNLKSLAIC